jgi:CDP-diacylglycerol--glycerol-3-phosphate 3-phosphatidyltransferase
VQIAAILAVIAVHHQPLWVSLLIYATVLITVLSGLDFFFGLRRRMHEAELRGPREQTPPPGLESS